MAVDPHHLAYWQRAMTAQQTAREQAKVQAWHEVKAIATMLRQRFGATRVIVFGSLLGDRIAQLVVNYPVVWHQVSSDYIAFVDWLRQLAQQLEGALGQFLCHQWTK